MQPYQVALESLDLRPTDSHPPPRSDTRFVDGSAFRVEIASVEGPTAFEAAIGASIEHGVRIDRVSQGSGIYLQTDGEIQRMVQLGQEHAIEVCLFVGPRAAWDCGKQVESSAGRVNAGALRGADQLGFAVAEVQRAVALGLRAVLVADLGLLSVLGRLRRAGSLPPDLRLKVSALLPVTNPATASVLAELGADSLNLAVDLSVAQIAAIRRAVTVPLDVYIEAPDDLGGCMRYYDIPELVRTAAPIYLKFGLRNAAPMYPSGAHLEGLAVASARERVRRAALGIALLKRHEASAP